MANSLFQALGGSPQAPAAPGSPGVAAGPQPSAEQLAPLFQALQQPPVDQHLQLGPKVAMNPEDVNTASDGYKQWRAQNPHVPEVVAQDAYANSQSKMAADPNDAISRPSGSAYSNFAKFSGDQNK